MKPFSEQMREQAEAVRVETDIGIRFPAAYLHGFEDGAQEALRSELVTALVNTLRSINVQQIVNGQVGQELRATEISELLAAYQRAVETERGEG